jgi:hypothetical protein
MLRLVPTSMRLHSSSTPTAPVPGPAVLWLLLTILAGSAWAGEHAEVLAAPECILDMERVQPQFPPLTPGQTYLMVRHHGDPDTPEWLGQVANPVTWDVSFYSGFRPAAPLANWQRGYYDAGPPIGSSAVQLRCTQFGFMLNTYAFSHTQPITGGGPNIAYERRLDPTPPAWPNPDSRMRIEVDFRLPWLYDVDADFALSRGVAQVSFFYYLQHLPTGRIVAHVIGLFENRPLGMGNGIEFVGNDTFFDFVSSPLLPTQANGQPVRFVRPGANSALMQTEEPFSDLRRFAAEVDHDAMLAIIAALDLRGPNGQPARPEEFGLRNVGVLIEAFVGTNNDFNISYAGSFDNFTVTRFGPAPVVGSAFFSSGFEAGETAQ